MEISLKKLKYKEKWCYGKQIKHYRLLNTGISPEAKLATEELRIKTASEIFTSVANQLGE